MARHPHIFLFSVHKDAMDAAVRAFTADWPEARVSNLLDDSLFAWVREAGGVVPEMYAVFRDLTRHMVGRGADGILFTCSAFRPVIDACIEEFELPILKPNDAMIDKALDAGSRIAVMATVGPTIASISVEIEQMAAARGRKVELVPYVVEHRAGRRRCRHARPPGCRTRPRHQELRCDRSRAIHALTRRSCRSGSQHDTHLQLAGRGGREDAGNGARVLLTAPS